MKKRNGTPSLVQKCVICDVELAWFGHNASPVADGLCCEFCNALVVIPARVEVIRCPECLRTNLNEDKTLCWDCQGKE